MLEFISNIYFVAFILIVLNVVSIIYLFMFVSLRCLSNFRNYIDNAFFK